MNIIKALLFLGLIIVNSQAMSAGRVTHIWFSGPDDPNHTDVIQIAIEGGFSGEYNAGGCDSSLAAIRNSSERQHLISFLLTAYATKEKIGVALNPSDKYHTNRCTISRIFSAD